MAEGLNRVMLMGNLGADPELRMTAGGQAVLKLRLATSETYIDKDKQKQERTEWHNVVIWGKRGEALSRILTKGSRMFVEGGLRTTSYDKDGTKVYRTEVVASNVLLQGGGAGAQRQERTSDAPRPGGAYPHTSAMMGALAPARMPAGGFPDMDEDNIPF
jgi:single-strand DNA-binding protein